MYILILKALLHIKVCLELVFYMVKNLFNVLCFIQIPLRCVKVCIQRCQVKILFWPLKVHDLYYWLNYNAQGLR
jgi:hypothetical protein